MNADLADVYDELYRLRCELADAIVKAYFDSHMSMRNIQTVTGLSEHRVKAILVAVNPQALESFGEPAYGRTGPGSHADPATGDTASSKGTPSPLRMPKRRQRTRRYTSGKRYSRNT